VRALAAKGFKVGQRTVANLLRQLDYSCQTNSKTREGSDHPDRDAQFAYINAEVKAAIAVGEPAISVNGPKVRLWKRELQALRRRDRSDDSDEPSAPWHQQMEQDRCVTNTSSKKGDVELYER
jgi:hypothetical protein